MTEENGWNEMNEEGQRSAKENEMVIFKAWAESYKAVSDMWEDSYQKLYKPWIESSGEMFDKAVEISREATPTRYRDFYIEWAKTYHKSFGRLLPMPTAESSRETLERLLARSDESIEICNSWIADLEDNARKTSEILQHEPDPVGYREAGEAWIKSYEKIFDQFLTLPAIESMGEMFEKYTGIPDIYFRNSAQITDLWRKSYAKMYGPWVDSMQKLSKRMVEISRHEAGPETYEEFLKLWMSTYKDTYDQYLQSMQLSEEAIDAFLQITDTWYLGNSLTGWFYLDKYKSWAEALKKMSDKTEEISKQTLHPETYMEFYDLWIKTYQKGFSTFFEDTPMVGPMKEMMEPIKIMSRMYTDSLAEMSKMWLGGSGCLPSPSSTPDSLEGDGDAASRKTH